MTYAFPPDLKSSWESRWRRESTPPKMSYCVMPFVLYPKRRKTSKPCAQLLLTGSQAIKACHWTRLSTPFEQGTALARIHEV